jgi:large subunit ribosomal protein L1
LSEAAAVASAPVEQNTNVRHTINKERIEPLTIHKAVSKIKSVAWAKFDETIEIAINTCLDPRKPNQSVKGVATLPYGTGKTVRVCVFANGVEAKEALDAGAEVIGAEDLVAKIQAGNVDFDTVIATPEMMSIVGKLGKVHATHFHHCLLSLISHFPILRFSSRYWVPEV